MASAISRRRRAHVNRRRAAAAEFPRSGDRDAAAGQVAPDGVAVFVRVTGEHTRNLAFVGNVYGRSAPVELAPDLAPEAIAQLDGSDAVGVRRPTSG